MRPALGPVVDRRGHREKDILFAQICLDTRKTNDPPKRPKIGKPWKTMEHFGKPGWTQGKPWKTLGQT